MRLSPTNVINETDFHNAWAKAVRFVMRNKHELVFGNTRKRAYDSCQMIEMTGHAIEQILAKETHPVYQFGGNRLGKYVEEYDRDWLREYLKRPEKEKFTYVYLERLLFPVDQLALMRENLRTQVEMNVTSNQCQATTWRPEEDPKMPDVPCLQRISARYLGNGAVDIRQGWRSRDTSAWQANVVALDDMINREIVEPCGCRIVRIIDTSDSLHVYHYDWEMAGEVWPVPVNPMMRR